MAKVVVVGSTNTDLTIRVPRIPAGGETILGHDFRTTGGGKGANQAVAAARAGGTVVFVSALGSDAFGDRALEDLARERIDIDLVRRVTSAPSGVALIFVDDAGENSIAVAPGANLELGPEDVRPLARMLDAGDVVLLQLEIPLATVEAAARTARERGARVILNPAPARALPDPLLADVSLLTPNESEAAQLSGTPVSDDSGLRSAAAALRDRGVRDVLITRGARGVFACVDGGFDVIEGFPTTAVDTTAAGDVFNGALAVALAEGRPIREAIRFASAAAAISVTRIGARASAPFRGEIQALLRNLVMLLLALLAAACGRGSEPPRQSPGAASDAPRIALIMKSLANEFFVTMADGARSHQAANPGKYTLIVNGIRNESDLTQQVALVEQMVAQGVNAIVIAPADSRALVPILAKARRQRIVVVNIDNKLDDETLKQAGIDIPFVGPDNRAGAQAVGGALARHLQRADTVAILEGIPTAFNAQQRRLGFEDAMRDAGMQVVAVQSAHWEQDRANTVAAAILREHPDLKAILASNDSMALGAAAAVRQAGRTGQVHVVGFDNIAAVQQLLKDGRILATADQHADQLAVYGIEYALQILRGDSQPQDKQTPVDVITAPAR